MKKILFSLGVCAMALTACTSEEVIEEGVQGNAIGFQNAVSKESRALTNASLEKFYVYGYYLKDGFTATPVNVFSAVEVRKTGTTWSYDNTRYLVPDTKYYFYAYSCENATAKVSASLNLTGSDVNARALRFSNYTCNDSHQHDLIYAEAEGIDGKEAENEPVSFNFKHILTKINVEFTSGFAAGYDIEISDVRIVNIRDNGNYNPKAATPWGVPTRTSETEGAEPFIAFNLVGGNVASVANGEVAAKKATTEDGYVIPYLYHDSNVWLEFDILVKKGDVEVLSSTLQGTWAPQWELGKSYTYKVKISGSEAGLEPIVFQTSQDMNLGWDAGDTTQVNMEFSAN